jgi:hypothetical protein
LYASRNSHIFQVLKPRAEESNCDVGVGLDYDQAVVEIFYCASRINANSNKIVVSVLTDGGILERGYLD